MPDNPAALLAEVTAAFFPVLIPVQAGLFLLLLLAVSFCDIRSREIPDSLQVAIAASTFLCFSPGNLLGILGALPYLVIALFFGGGHSIGGGDIKLAASTGLVLGLPGALMGMVVGLMLQLLFHMCSKCVLLFFRKQVSSAYPMAPFLAIGYAAAYYI